MPYLENNNFYFCLKLSGNPGQADTSSPRPALNAMLLLAEDALSRKRNNKSDLYSILISVSRDFLKNISLHQIQ